MGALAPPTLWIPEDDVLLKNAVEAGASLECLAKGAVSFSRRFSLQELRDRWHSLLYDPKISEEASARMLEVEMEVSIPNLSKSKKSCGGSNVKGGSVKRKVDSIRNHYYAMRKRICSEPHTNFGCDSHTRSGERNSENVNVNIQTEGSVGKCISVATCFAGGATSIHYEHPEAGFNADADNAFPMMRRAGTVASASVAPHNSFHSRRVGTQKVEIPDGILDQDSLYGIAENASSIPIDKSVGNGLRNSFQHGDVHDNFPRILGENMDSFGNCLGVTGVGSAHTLPVNDLFDSEDLNLKPLNIFDSVNDKHHGLCSGFGGHQDPSSMALDGGASFHELGYSSEPPVMPIWRTMEDISTSMPKVEKVNSPGFDVTRSDPRLNDGMCADGLDNPMSFCGSIADLSNSPLDFSDELFYMDVEGKDLNLDGLNSILLNSPIDEHRVNMPDSGGPEAFAPVDSHLLISDGACVGSGSHTVTVEVCCKATDPKIDLPETSVEISYSAQPCKDLMICVLNTEDRDVPCNDDVVFTSEEPQQAASSEVHNNMMETSGMASFSTKGYPDSLKAREGFDVHKVKHETHVNHPAFSPNTGKQPETDSIYTDGKRFRNVLSENYSVAVVSRQLSNAGRDTNSPSLTSAALQPSLINVSGKAKLGFDVRNLTSSTGWLNKAVKGTEHAITGSVDVPGGCGASMALDVQKCASSHAEQASLDAGMLMPNFDQEQEVPACDREVPYFSDIEALILDMDLGIDDQESCLSKEVSNYQKNDTKKAIIRLEQGARAYMQRAISSHGAFAVLYGRRLKHYIRKPEVSLGRGAEDIHVDIDLGREGRANKISRRQATIKMTEDGSFFIKNVGRHSIFVNGKEVMVKQHLHLIPGCLIEMRGMAFIFEVNQKSVDQYIANISKSEVVKKPKLEIS
ncbi:hypothetical protein QJS04_geneDACA012233 [Acorus gramineus]|uniref:FHA domain-containing protein n=1 Tax=Acorus gramineus TaxID=55184 RepID=A0AAV9BCX7_ACOGR|nr:hypothetical protein QJS04_geneDACA012233 [Acorus gramineus]